MLKQTAYLPGSWEKNQASRRLCSLIADLCPKSHDSDLVGRSDSETAAGPGLPVKGSDHEMLVPTRDLHALDTGPLYMSISAEPNKRSRNPFKVNRSC